MVSRVSSSSSVLYLSFFFWPSFGLKNGDDGSEPDGLTLGVLTDWLVVLSPGGVRFDSDAGSPVDGNSVELLRTLFERLFWKPNMVSLLTSIRGTDTAYGGIMMSRRLPKLHSSTSFWRHMLCVVMPHHSHFMPAKHSDVQHVFLHTTHFEFDGRLPSRQWCRLVCEFRFRFGTYVAVSQQSLTANTRQSTWT